MYKFLCTALLAALGSAANATPAIYIANVYDYLDGTQTSYRKRVTNTGDSTAFVRVNLFEIIYGEGEPQEVPVHDASAEGPRQGLIATPSRLMIPPNATQATRLLFLGERERERYYRVRFIPVAPDKDDAFGLSDAEREAYKASLQAGVNVLTGYGAIFIVRPTATRFDTRIEQTATRYSLTNAGNSTVVLEDLKDCSAGDDPVCEPSRLHHVMPGSTYSVDKRPGRVTHFKRIEGDARYPTQV